MGKTELLLLCDFVSICAINLIMLSCVCMCDNEFGVSVFVFRVFGVNAHVCV